jgi:IS5 family transposase
VDADGRHLPGRVTKAQILDAVREAKGEASAQLIEHLKKGDMAQEAERLLGLGVAHNVPYCGAASWTHPPSGCPGARTALNGKPATEALFTCFDASLRAASYIAMSGQSVDATLVVAPRQRNTAEEKADIKAGRGPAPGTARPAKRELASIDRRLT